MSAWRHYKNSIERLTAAHSLSVLASQAALLTGSFSVLLHSLLLAIKGEKSAVGVSPMSPPITLSYVMYISCYYKQKAHGWDCSILWFPAGCLLRSQKLEVKSWNTKECINKLVSVPGRVLDVCHSSEYFCHLTGRRKELCPVWTPL